MAGNSKRESRILDYLRVDSEITVSELSRLLEVSVVTVRNDLRSLEEQGMVIRSHGGAIPAFHPDMLQKKASHLQEKVIANAKAEAGEGTTEE